MERWVNLEDCGCVIVGSFRGKDRKFYFLRCMDEFDSIIVGYYFLFYGL